MVIPSVRPDSERKRMIEVAVASRPGAGLSHHVELWEKLADELVPIIGEGGFRSLFERSLHLCQTTWPCLIMPPDSVAPGRFTGLRSCLEACEPAQSSAANLSLLMTFNDILAMLIGEILTTRILKSAWGDDLAGYAAEDIEHE